MPDPTLISGNVGVVMLNSENFTAVATVVNLNKSRNAKPKGFIGKDWTQQIPGKKSVAFSAQGSISAEHAAGLEAAYESDLPIQFSLQVGQAGGTTDGGLHSGYCIVTGLAISVDGDGEYEFSIDAVSTGEVTYTPAGGGS